MFRRNRTQRVLAISSGGGHWVELLRVMSAFEGAEIVYGTVQNDYRSSVAGHRMHVVSDATRWNRMAVLRMAFQVLLVVLRERPDIVVSTGAAPGYFAMRFGKWIGARTIWIDSIANVEALSMSGQMAGRYADLWLTQWKHLARRPNGPEFAGAIL